MKKIISAAAAIALACGASITAFATDAPVLDKTVIKNVQGSTDPDPAQANTTVQFSCDPKYTVTIPKTIDLSTENTDGTFSGTGSVEAEDVCIGADQKVNVKISSTSGFTLSETGSSATLAYEVKNGTTVFANNDTVASFTNCESDSTELTFVTKTAPQYSGSYTDTVVFVISVGA